MSEGKNYNKNNKEVNLGSLKTFVKEKYINLFF
jgi:hypothetical protein